MNKNQPLPEAPQVGTIIHKAILDVQASVNLIFLPLGIHGGILNNKIYNVHLLYKKHRFFFTAVFYYSKYIHFVCVLDLF